MEEYNRWKIFESTGRVTDYLNYRAQVEERQEKEHEQQQPGGNYSAGNDTSEHSPFGF